MPAVSLPESKHFALEPLAGGVYACVHKPGGAAFSNAGIVDMGDQTLIVDAFQTLLAGRVLRQAAETLFARPVSTVVLTHAHNDHWMGTPAFDARTTVLASKTTRQVCAERGPEIVKDFEDPAQWEGWLGEIREQLATEQDERVRAGLERSATFVGYALAEMAGYQPRYADKTFESVVTFEGSERTAELRSLGPGHSEDDAVLLLPRDGVAFIGDVGFFDAQPYMGSCDIDLYRQQLRFFRDSDYLVLVPGHGPVGGREHVALQLSYLDVMEDLVGQVVRRGGSFEEAMKVPLPEPFDGWLMGGMERFKVNVRYLFAHLGGELPAEE